MPVIDDKNDTGDEEMEEDTPESEKSDDDDSDSGTGSDGDESSGETSAFACIIARPNTLPFGFDKLKSEDFA